MNELYYLNLSILHQTSCILLAAFARLVHQLDVPYPELMQQVWEVLPTHGGWDVPQPQLSARISAMRGAHSESWGTTPKKRRAHSESPSLYAMQMNTQFIKYVKGVGLWSHADTQTCRNVIAQVATHKHAEMWLHK